jgi:uncharacterized protein YjiS (DUF1127 family)
MSATILPRMTSTQSDGVTGKLRALAGAWRERARDRAAFAQMDDRDLRDRGLDRASVAYALNKPFWRISSPL